MERIRGQMNCHKYGTVEDMVQDFLLMFDNACKYNEPDSLIYKVKTWISRGMCILNIKNFWSLECYLCNILFYFS